MGGLDDTLAAVRIVKAAAESVTEGRRVALA
jgi:hypothetical protein